MKVSFDYDSTLSRKAVQKFAKQLIAEGHEVWIVTSRHFKNKPIDYNKDLFRTAYYVGIPTNQIYFTEFEGKWRFFNENPDFLFHVDDNRFENLEINDDGKVIGVNCWRNSMRWKEECLEILKNVEK